SVRHVKRACRLSPEPRFRHFCSWAASGAEQRRILTGMLYALTDPLSAAVGFCIGRDQCAASGVNESVQRMRFSMKGQGSDSFAAAVQAAAAAAAAEAAPAHGGPPVHVPADASLGSV